MDWRHEVESPRGYNMDVMTYFGLKDLKARNMDEGEVVGINTDAEVGFRSDGAKIYVKDVESSEDDTVQSHIAAHIYGNHIPSVTPEISYDDAYRKIMMEEMPGEFIDDYQEVDQRSLHRAIAEKLLVGDCDYGGNFLATDYNVRPIDYDMVGRDLVTAKEAIDTWMGDELDEELLNREASKLAEEVDIRALEQDLREEKTLNETWSNRDESRDPEPRDGLFHGSIDNILSNVRAFQH